MAPESKPGRMLGRLAAVAVLMALGSARIAGGFDDGKARFSLRVKGLMNPYRVMSVTALPGESIPIETLLKPEDRYGLEADCGELRQVKGGRWHFQAPSTGRCRVKVRSLSAGDTMELNVFVLVPYRELADGRLERYRIGEYASKPLKGDPVYARPRGFVEVKKEDDDLHLTPHFKLKQFLSKQADPFPKYLLFDERLLLKLERILAELNTIGISVDTLHVMSGYRTPFYNKAIGNVPYSMHVWGGAADVFVDKDENDIMDDLTGDKRVDLEDARYLYELVDRLEHGEERWPHLRPPSDRRVWTGGLGMYAATPAHGPFVHVDVRGRQARWGNAPTRERSCGQVTATSRAVSP